MLAGLDIERVMDALQRAVPIPQHEVGMCGAFRRQVLRQRLPLAARREHVEDRVQNLADVHLAPTPTAFGRRYRRFDQRPLAVAQIARVAQAVAVGRTAMFRLPHIGTPQPRFGCQRRNHNRFLRFNNFVDRLSGLEDALSESNLRMLCDITAWKLDPTGKRPYGLATVEVRETGFVPDLPRLIVERVTG